VSKELKNGIFLSNVDILNLEYQEQFTKKKILHYLDQQMQKCHLEHQD
jgi:hypothetical protein